MHNNRPPQSQEKPKCNWKSAIDPKSGMKYYYHTITRETTWHKPPELATSDERKAMIEKREKQRQFFALMESNIIKSLEHGYIPGDDNNGSRQKKLKHTSLDDDLFGHGEEEEELAPLKSSQMKLNRNDVNLSQQLMEDMSLDGGNDQDEQLMMVPPKKAKLVRTISGLDDNVINELSSMSPASVIEACNTTGATIAETPMSIEAVKQAAEAMANGQSSKDLIYNAAANDDNCKNMIPLKGPLLRRNTGGTMYVGSTMSDPDKDAMIKCICGVFRAHLLQSFKDKLDYSHIPFPEYDVFNDDIFTQTKCMKMDLDEVTEQDIPSLEDITLFYRNIFRKSQMEPDCIIMSLIYIERLVKETNGGVRPKIENWRSLLFSCMILSSKVWDDLSMWNSDFSQVCKSFTLKRVNQLEIAVLSALKYNVKVKASEYAKYYFLCRSMLIRSGLGSNDLQRLNPLDIDGAARLVNSSEKFQKLLAQKQVLTKKPVSRSQSLSAEVETKLAHRNDGYNNVNSSDGGKKKTTPKVSLEQVVNM